MAPLLLYQLVTIFVLTPSSQHLAQGTTLDIITPRQQSATAGTSADDCDIFIDIGSQFLSSSGECVHVNQHYNYTTWNCLSSFTFPDHTCIRIHQDLTYTQLGFVINFVNITGVRITSVPATTNGAGQGKLIISYGTFLVYIIYPLRVVFVHYNYNKFVSDCLKV